MNKCFVVWIYVSSRRYTFILTLCAPASISSPRASNRSKRDQRMCIIVLFTPWNCLLPTMYKEEMKEVRVLKRNSFSKSTHTSAYSGENFSMPNAEKKSFPASRYVLNTSEIGNTFHVYVTRF